MTRLLWTLQALLALVFLLAGGVKLATPIDALIQMIPLEGTFLRFIGCCETLGAIGLILPSLLRIRPQLTAWAAAGLVVIMTGATLLTPYLTDGQIAPAALPFVLGCLAAFVAYGRARLAPITARSRLPMASVAQPA